MKGRHTAGNSSAGRQQGVDAVELRRRERARQAGLAGVRARRVGEPVAQGGDDAASWRRVAHWVRQRPWAKRGVVVVAVAFHVAVVAWLVYAFLRFNHVIENPRQHNPGWLCEPELDPHSCAPRP